MIILVSCKMVNKKIVIESNDYSRSIVILKNYQIFENNDDYLIMDSVSLFLGHHKTEYPKSALEN